MFTPKSVMSLSGRAEGCMPQQRRMHIRVSATHFLPVLLRVIDLEASGWFGERQLSELMALLHEELPHRLPAVLDLRTPAQRAVPALQCDSLCARLTFQPTASSFWLLCDGVQHAAGGPSSSSSALIAVPYTLLLDVEPLGVEPLGTMDGYLSRNNESARANSHGVLPATAAEGSGGRPPG